MCPGLERIRLYKLPRHEKEKILEKLRQLLTSRDEIVLAVVYGSFLEDKPFRDIDIAVYIGRDVDVLGYELELEEELSRHLGLPVDVRVIDEAPPWFVKKVLGKGKVVISRLPFAAERLYLKALDEETLAHRHLCQAGMGSLSSKTSQAASLTALEDLERREE